jgi:polysaccharide deacetylase 2 family uncharacterized protein YibQ
MAKSRAHKKAPQPFPQILTFILFLMALISVAGLDYVNWISGKSSFLFKTEKTLEAIPPEVEKPETYVLAEIVLKQTQSQGIPLENKSQFYDTDGTFHLKLDIPEKSYESLKPLLEAEFAAFQAIIEKQTAFEEKDTRHHLWNLSDRKGGRMSLLISCPKEVVPEEKPLEVKKAKGRVAIIIDDMGYSLQAIKEIIRMNQNITISILPDTLHATETAELAREKGLEVLLHLPMESDSSDSVQNKVPGIVLSSMNTPRIIEVFNTDLAQIPYASGVNNHMGSKITRDKAIMETILNQVKRNNLFFVDSLTTGASLAYDMARSMGIPTAKRHVFLDGVLTEEYISHQMKELILKAKKLGEAIGICHPSEITFKVLAEKLPEIRKNGLELVFVSALVH